MLNLYQMLSYFANNSSSSNKKDVHSILSKFFTHHSLLGAKDITTKFFRHHYNQKSSFKLFLQETLLDINFL